jgi:hypothetical protein
MLRARGQNKYFKGSILSTHLMGIISEKRSAGTLSFS